MHRYLGITLLTLTSFISFSQEEKGCGVNNTFNVSYGQTPEGYPNHLIGCSGMWGMSCLTDTVFIELDAEGDVLMKWRFFDELMLGFSNITQDPIEWYRNDSLIDPSEFSVYNEVVVGACGPKHIAGATLETQIPGSYQLRKTHYEVNLAVIVVREKSTSVEIVEEVPLKIYPNPSSDVLFIEHGEINNADVILYSIDGKLIAHPTINSSGGRTEIDISQLTSGSYILTFSSDQHQLIRKKINVI